MTRYLSLIIFAFATVHVIASDQLGKADIFIVKNSGVTETEIKEILVVRRKKDENEIWKVDLLKGDVRIIKTRKDKIQLLPGGAVEFWFKNSDGKWQARLTA